MSISTTYLLFHVFYLWFKHCSQICLQKNIRTCSDFLGLWLFSLSHRPFGQLGLDPSLLSSVGEKISVRKWEQKIWRKGNSTWRKSCLRWAFWRSTVPIQCWKWPGRWSQLSPVWDHFLSRGLSHTELACRKRGRPEPRNRNIPTHIIVHTVWHQKMNSYITQSQCKSCYCGAPF